MQTITFNHTKPVVTELHNLPPLESNWPVEDWKYADVKLVYPRTTDLVRAVIDAAPISGLFKRVLIDVKVQDLTPDIYSCIPGWHFDGAFPEDGVEPDRHHLFVANGPLTEFIDEPVKLSVSDNQLSKYIREAIALIPDSVKVATCAPNAITTFTSYDLHRGVRTAEPTRRLLVRLTETNTILPRNKPQRPSQGARTDL